MAENGAERRSYARFEVDLGVEVYDMAGGARDYLETTHLCDISGGGARFASHCPDRYSIGQRLFISIALPETETRQPSMQGKATVAWVVDGDGEGDGSVGVCMDDLLVFEHLGGIEPATGNAE